MGRSVRFSNILAFALLVAIGLGGCSQLFNTPAPTLSPTATKVPTATITPTPEPQRLFIADLVKNCAGLDEKDIPVILQGRIQLPDSTIYGYEGWLGMDFITSQTMRVLVSVGTGTNSMDTLPEFYSQKDLIIRDYEGRVIRQGHQVRVTGRVKYRADSDTRRCEVFADRIEALEKPELLIPLDMQVKKFPITVSPLDDPCLVLEESRQFVRLTGSLNVDDYTSGCPTVLCSVVFADQNGTMVAKIARGEGPNTMVPLPEQFTRADLQVRDRNGELVDPREVTLVGVLQGSVDACEIIVYEID